MEISIFCYKNLCKYRAIKLQILNKSTIALSYLNRSKTTDSQTHRLMRTGSHFVPVLKVSLFQVSKKDQ